MVSRAEWQQITHSVAKKKCQSGTFVVVNKGSGSRYLVLAFFLGC